MNKIFRFRLLDALELAAAFLATIAVFSVAAMFLWNALIPEIFGLPALTYWQTVGMGILARILFGGLHIRPHGKRGRDDRMFQHGNALREKWLNMGDDERKEFLRGRREFSHFHEFFDERSGESKKDAPSSEGGKRE